MLEDVLGEVACLEGVRVAAVLVLVHAERVATFTSDWVTRAAHQIGHSRLDELVDVENRGAAGVIGQGEGKEEGGIVGCVATDRTHCRVCFAGLVNATMVVKGVGIGAARDVTSLIVLNTE